MSNVALELTNVRKKIKNKEIIKDVNLTIRQGEVYGFIGPNGAGKTTTIRMIVGLMDLTDGEIKVLGKSIEKEYKDAARNLGAIVENPEMYPFMTGRQNLSHFARMYDDVPKGRVEEVITLVGLDQAIDEKVSKYSLGMRQRLGIAQAILHKPAVLILDEPTNGLDPAGIREIRDYIRRLAVEDNVAVMISSHLLSEIELMCDRIGIIKHGELITEQSVKEDSEEADQSEIKVVLDVKETEEAIKVLASLELKAEKEGSQLVSLMTRETIPQVVNKLVESGVTIYGVTGVKPSLEDQFLELTGGNIIE
ncbi:ABC transporter ATP-binding protein [Allobacillus sp. GCM10007491]|uniref:ABC transporter ATP-binding protein n=1 Tax=Allobacillus saliphilus TaxID=2912308 RepID=A0A941CTR6_9BACI|nr:ABC transporter ATP-binding protein [Allobacillus saliphilus]MBR7553064.1 ABC transporter ATP-binding protein [Allobacillus saliphilus]